MTVTITEIQRLCRQYGFRAEAGRDRVQVYIWDWDWEEVEQYVVELAMSDAFK